MGRVPSPGPRLVFGGSYGSLWGQRLLQDQPQGIDRMWLDSIVDLEGTLERVDEHADAAMKALLQSCAEIRPCAGMFHDEPLERARLVLQRYDGGAGCGAADGITRGKLQALMYAWLSGPPAYWALAAAGYARADRRHGGDVVALRHAVERSRLRRPDGAGLAYNPVLNRQVLYRELYRFDVDVADRTAIQKSFLATRRSDVVTAIESQAFGAGWRVPGDASTSNAATDLILLSGRLDPLDPREWAERTFAAGLRLRQCS